MLWSGKWFWILFLQKQKIVPMSSFFFFSNSFFRKNLFFLSAIIFSFFFFLKYGIFVALTKVLMGILVLNYNIIHYQSTYAQRETTIQSKCSST